MGDLNLWMFELVFVCIININLFNAKIYIHKKISMAIIGISVILNIFKIEKILKNDKKKLYKDYIWIIPIVIISYIFIIFIRDYSLCKIKWLFDSKYISELKIITFYGLIDTILYAIGVIISSNIECVSKDKFAAITYICRIDNKSKTKNYYANFKIFFEELWDEGIKFILLFIWQNFILFIDILLAIIIIKKLNTEIFYLC